ncbi:MAG: aminotransferase class I/II-fold pyridoxal phosphate-dependent enzyme [Thermodesulfobacteriota bacterium]
MNPIAEELNRIISNENEHLIEMMANLGKELFFPKGILSQGAEAKEKAFKMNATIGIATENHRTMHFNSVMEHIEGILPEESLNYAPSFGMPALRKTWQNALFLKNPSLSGHKISLPVVTCGVTHAASTFADLWINPDDVVVLPDKMWGNYSMIFSVRKRARLSHFPLFTQTGNFNVEAFENQLRKESQVSGKVTALMNFPNNPTGYSPTVSDADAIIRVLTELAEDGINVLAACDDSYFGLFYDKAVYKESIFGGLVNRHPRLLAVKLDGATKENFVWGLRVGFITYGCHAKKDATKVYEALEKKTAGCIRGNISNASHLSQSIILKSMTDTRYVKEKKEKFEILKKRAEQVQNVLQDPRYKDVWDVYPFNSGYFMCLRLKSVNAETLRLHLLDKYGVGLISIGDRDLRVAFSCLEESEIPELFDLILQGIHDLTKPTF